DVRYVQHELLCAGAFCAEEALDAQAAAERPGGDKPRLRLEGDSADLGLNLALHPGFLLLGLVSELELQRRQARGRVAQRAGLKQPAAQLDPVPRQARRRAPSATSTSLPSSSARAWCAPYPS